jgi:hypothetical protein
MRGTHPTPSSRRKPGSNKAFQPEQRCKLCTNLMGPGFRRDDE